MSKLIARKSKTKISADVQTPQSADESAVESAAAPARARASMIWAAVFSAGVALLVTSTIVAVIRSYTPLPKWDQWAEVLWLKYYYAGQWHFSDLWRQHNEHRIFFPRLFLLADWFLFRGTNIFPLCCILLLQAGHAWIFIREIRKRSNMSAAVRLTVVAIVAALFFSGANLENFTWAFQISFILAFYAGTLSLYALIRYAETRERRNSWVAAGWLAASAGSGFVATHSLANGILIWPVLLLTGILLQLPRRVLALFGFVFVLVAVQFFVGYHLIAGHGNSIAALRHPIAVLSFWGAYLALPVAHINHSVGAAVGLALLSGVAWATVRALRRRTSSRFEVLNLSVMLFITAGGFVTALGRLAVVPPEGALRYATPSCIFWACALLLALAEVESLPQKATAIAVVLATAITGLIITILPLHLDLSSQVIQFEQTIRETEMAMRVDVDAAVQVSAIYPDPEAAFSLIDVLRMYHRSVFAGNPVIVGELLRPEYQLVNQDRCRGTWESSTVVDHAIKPGVSVSGWAWDTTRNRQPDQVLFLDDSRVIRGLAGFTRERGDVAAAFHTSRMKSSGWFGFTQRTVPGAPYRAYALLSDGRSLCPLATFSEIQRPLPGVFRQNQWFIDSNKTGAWEPDDRQFFFGIPGDVPVSGDWDGSGVIRAGVFRKGVWLLDWNNNGRWDEGDRQFLFGVAGDIPVVGDWNHTGTTKAGVFRDGTWILDWYGEQKFTLRSRTFSFGTAGDIPVTGDWDGSGAVHVGVFRRGVWYLDDGDFQLTGQDKMASFGLAGDQPVTGDWNGLGVTKIGVFRNGQWILDIDGKLQWDPRYGSITFGLPGDTAVIWKK